MTASNNRESDNSHNLENLEGVSLSDDEFIQQLVSELRPDLKALSPESGVNRFLRQKSDITSNTLDEYAAKLDRLVGFCEQQNINDVREFDGRTLDDYAHYLRYEASDEVDELSPKTMRDELYLLRDFVSYLERIEAVRQGISRKIEIPDLTDDEKSRDVDMDADRVEQILEYLARFEYATLEHVVWILAARIARRTTACISLDVDDAHLDENEPYLEFKHRPPETRLKNRKDSEGNVALTDQEAEIIADFIDINRPDITDDAGRSPLLATSKGRLSKSTFRRYIYKWSRPCMVTGSCPHDRDPDDCEATQSLDHASKCPDSRSPHALRHGYISEPLRQGVPIEVITDRCDVTEEVIREFYDETDQEERLDFRREILDEFSSENGGGYL